MAPVARAEGTRGRWKSCGVLWRSIQCWPTLRDLDLHGLLGGVRMIRSGRTPSAFGTSRFPSWSSAACREWPVLDHADGLPLPHDRGPLLAQAALIPAMPPVNFLVFFAPGQLHLSGVDDDDVVPGVDEGGVYRLVLALQQFGGQRRHPAQHLATGVDDMPPAVARSWRSPQTYA